MRKILVLFSFLIYSVTVAMDNNYVVNFANDESSAGKLHQQCAKHSIRWSGLKDSAFTPVLYFSDAYLERDFADVFALHSYFYDYIYSDPKEFSAEQIEFEIACKDLPFWDDWAKEKSGPLFYKVLRSYQGLIGVTSYFVLKSATGMRRRARILDFMISPEFQSQGAGKLLMELILGDLVKKVEDVELFVKSANERAIGFYEHFGFELEEITWSNGEKVCVYTGTIQNRG